MSEFDELLRDDEAKKRGANEQADGLRSMASAIYAGFASKLGCPSSEIKYELIDPENAILSNSRGVPTCIEFNLNILKLGKAIRVEIFHRGDHYEISLYKHRQRTIGDQLFCVLRQGK
jgi:hypothetical protein